MHLTNACIARIRRIETKERAPHTPTLDADARPVRTARDDGAALVRGAERTRGAARDDGDGDGERDRADDDDGARETTGRARDGDDDDDADGDERDRASGGMSNERGLGDVANEHDDGDRETRTRHLWVFLVERNRRRRADRERSIHGGRTRVGVIVLSRRQAIDERWERAESAAG